MTETKEIRADTFQALQRLYPVEALVWEERIARGEARIVER